MDDEEYLAMVAQTVPESVRRYLRRKALEDAAQRASEVMGGGDFAAPVVDAIRDLMPEQLPALDVPPEDMVSELRRWSATQRDTLPMIWPDDPDEVARQLHIIDQTLKVVQSVFADSLPRWGDIPTTAG